MTTYKRVPGYDGYMAGDNGEVYSLKTSRFLKKIYHYHGYYMCSLYGNGKATRMWLHRVVMLTFYGPSDLYVNHKNGNGLDNNIENLEYCTQSENILHSYRVLKNKAQRGSARWNSKILESDAMDIYKSEEPIKILSERYKVSQATISLIKNGLTWRHATVDLLL